MEKEVKKAMKKALEIMVNQVDYFEDYECKNSCFELEDGTKFEYCDFLEAFEKFIQNI